jgi:hypothetical protein
MEKLTISSGIIGSVLISILFFGVAIVFFAVEWRGMAIFSCLIFACFLILFVVCVGIQINVNHRMERAGLFELRDKIRRAKID